jgi:hypothetical protein
MPDLKGRLKALIYISRDRATEPSDSRHLDREEGAASSSF